MGLDISAWDSLGRQTAPGEEDTNFDALRLYVNPDFPEHADGIETGWYIMDEESAHKGLTYGSYNRWRAAACLQVFHVSFDEFIRRAETWLRSELEEDGVAWLFYFADNEGIIGPRTSAKIARSMAHYPEVFSEEWRQLFEIAARGGVVRFG
jgi:hypothetical protein